MDYKKLVFLTNQEVTVEPKAIYRNKGSYGFFWNVVIEPMSDGANQFNPTDHLVELMAEIGVVHLKVGTDGKDWQAQIEQGPITILKSEILVEGKSRISWAVIASAKGKSIKSDQAKKPDEVKQIDKPHSREGGYDAKAHFIRRMEDGHDIVIRFLEGHYPEYSISPDLILENSRIIGCSLFIKDGKE